MEVIGRRDRRITIQRPDGNVNADTGEPSGTWVKVCSVWAERQSMKGKDRLLADQTISAGDEVFIIKYRTDISPKMRVVFKSENYHITSVEEIGRNHLMRIVCQRLA